MQLLDGKIAAAALRARVKAGAETLKAERGIAPGLGVVLVGDDPASRVYVSMKEKACAEAGIVSLSHRLDESASQSEIEDLVRTLNADKNVHGILVQDPLPSGLDIAPINALIAPEKDVDGVGAISLGRILLDEPGYQACTARGILELLAHYDIDLKGKKCVVVGRSITVGKPAALLALQRHATVTLCHSRTQNLEAEVRAADILIAAIGKPEFIQGEWIKEGAVVVDAGYNRIEGRKGDVGDVDFAGASQRASWITPVPGGVGPMTIAVLIQQTFEAAQRTTA